MRTAALALMVWLSWTAGAGTLSGGEARPELAVDDGWRYTSKGWENISTWGIERQRVTGIPQDSVLWNRFSDKKPSLWVVSLAAHPLTLAALLLLATVPLWLFSGGGVSESADSSP